MSDPKTQYKKYRRIQIAEMADWEPGFDMTGVSVSEADATNGSPKPGDKIVRNPANHQDRWLVAEAYFKANFEEVGSVQQFEPNPDAKAELAIMDAERAIQQMTVLLASYGVTPDDYTPGRVCEAVFRMHFELLQKR